MGFAVVGAVSAFLSVALGAFGAHALKSRLSDNMLTVYEKGVLYQMFHSLALIAVGVMMHLGLGGDWMRMAGWLFTIGTALFSGSLYLLSASGKRALGAITPIGGLCFLAGWVLFVVSIA